MGGPVQGHSVDRYLANENWTIRFQGDCKPTKVEPNGKDTKAKLMIAWQALRDTILSGRRQPFILTH